MNPCWSGQAQQLETVPQDPPLFPEATRRAEQQPGNMHNANSLIVRDLVSQSQNLERMFRQDGHDPMPMTYHPEASSSSALPGTYLPATPNDTLARDLQAIHEARQAAMRRATERRTRRNKGKGKDQGSSGTNGVTFTDYFTAYAGTDLTCSLCTEDVFRGSNVYRLTCNHLFHYE